MRLAESFMNRFPSARVDLGDLAKAAGYKDTLKHHRCASQRVWTWRLPPSMRRCIFAHN